MQNQPIMLLPLAQMFMSPWFVGLGALLASIPIIIHILNRRRFKIVKWAAMEYLLQAMRKNRRRLKFEQWLLLAVRCLLIFLMGMALARPLGCDSSTIAALGGQRTALHIVVIDNSYSMGYEANRPNAKTHLDQAKMMARKLLDRLSAGNEAVMVISAASPIDLGRGGDPHAVTPKPTYDLQAARNSIDRIEQTWTGTDINGALQLAIRTAREEGANLRKHLYIFTDATRSAFEGEGKNTDVLKQTGAEVAKLFGRPYLFALGKPGQWNQAALDVSPGENLVTTMFDTSFVGLARGFGSGSDPVVQWKRDDTAVGTAKSVKLDLDTPPQSTGMIKFTEGGPHVMSMTLAGDDRLKADNTFWRVVEVAAEMRVLIVEGERGVGTMQGSGSFLELALSPPREADSNGGGASGGRKTNSYVAPEPPIGELELQNKVLGNYRAVFLTNVGQVTPAQAKQMKSYVKQGGTLILFMGPNVNADNYNAQMVTRGLMPGRLIKTVTGSDKTFHFDFDPSGNLHPFLREFRGLSRSGLNTAQITAYIQAWWPGSAGGTVSRDDWTQATVGDFVETPADVPAGYTAALVDEDQNTFEMDQVAPGKFRTRRAVDVPGAYSLWYQRGASDRSLKATVTVYPLVERVLNYVGEGKDPAITVHALGKGRVLFFSTTANPEWNLINPKPVFVALIHEMLGGSIGSGDRWMNLTVGQHLEVPPGMGLSAAPQLLDSSKNPLPMEATTAADGVTAYRSARPMVRPGLYTLNTGTRTIPIAVNVPRGEADIRVLSAEAVRKALGDIDLAMEEESNALAALKADSSNDWSWMFMALVFLLAGLECFMAMRFGHYRRQVRAVAPAGDATATPAT